MTAPLCWAVGGFLAQSGVAIAAWIKAGGGTNPRQREHDDQKRRHANRIQGKPQ